MFGSKPTQAQTWGQGQGNDHNDGTWGQGGNNQDGSNGGRGGNDQNGGRGNFGGNQGQGNQGQGGQNQQFGAGNQWKRDVTLAGGENAWAAAAATAFSNPQLAPSAQATVPQGNNGQAAAPMPTYTAPSGNKGGFGKRPNGKREAEPDDYAFLPDSLVPAGGYTTVDGVLQGVGAAPSTWVSESVNAASMGGNGGNQNTQKATATQAAGGPGGAKSSGFKKPSRTKREAEPVKTGEHGGAGGTGAGPGAGSGKGNGDPGHKRPSWWRRGHA